MGNKDTKILRGQLRQIVKDIFPDLIKEELYKDFQRLTQERLNEVHKMVKETLEKIDDRQKSVQSMVMREIANAAQSKSEPKSE